MESCFIYIVRIPFGWSTLYRTYLCCNVPIVYSFLFLYDISSFQPTIHFLSILSLMNFGLVYVLFCL